MSRSTKDAWLSGPGDLEEADVEDVPTKGSSVRVRALPATYSNRAQSKALEMKQTPRGDSTATVNTEQLEILQFAYGCVEPTFTEDEAAVIAEKWGPAFSKVIRKIVELSGIEEDSVETATARFQGGSASKNGGDVEAGAATGSGGSRLPSPAGGKAGDAGR